MNLTNLILWSAGIITAWIGAHNIDSIQRTILKAQAQLIYESRTETWGSPKFLHAEFKPKVSSTKPHKKETDFKQQILRLILTIQEQGSLIPTFASDSAKALPCHGLRRFARSVGRALLFPLLLHPRPLIFCEGEYRSRGTKQNGGIYEIRNSTKS